VRDDANIFIIFCFVIFEEIFDNNKKDNMHATTTTTLTTTATATTLTTE